MGYNFRSRIRASRSRKCFIFVKKTSSVVGIFIFYQVQKFCSSQKLEHPQVEIFESKKVGNFSKNPENFQCKINENRFSQFSRFSIFIDFPLKIFAIFENFLKIFIFYFLFSQTRCVASISSMSVDLHLHISDAKSVRRPTYCFKRKSRKLFRASRLPKCFIFVKKTSSVAGIFIFYQVQKF